MAVKVIRASHGKVDLAILLEAVRCGLWKPPSNSAAERLAQLAELQETAA